MTFGKRAACLALTLALFAGLFLTAIPCASAAETLEERQQAVVDVLSRNLIAAARSLGERKVVLAGGVAANSALKAAVKARAAGAGMKVYCPRPLLCTDNGAMIASAAHYAWLSGRESGADMNAVANWDLEEL